MCTGLLQLALSLFLFISAKQTKRVERFLFGLVIFHERFKVRARLDWIQVGIGSHRRPIVKAILERPFQAHNTIVDITQLRISACHVVIGRLELKLIQTLGGLAFESTRAASHRAGPRQALCSNHVLFGTG